MKHINQLPTDTVANKKIAQRTKWIFNLLYFSGCRRSEVINAKMSDFIHKNGQWWLKVIGKGNKYGEIPVPPLLLRELINYRHSLNLTDLPNNYETNIPLISSISSANNKKLDKIVGISDSMLYKIIKKTCNNIANAIKPNNPSDAFIIEKVSTHWLRHTSATHQVDAGIDIRMVKENLRHSLLETTMKYQHTEDIKRHRDTSNKFGN
jgi:integrase/recombinase XerC